MKRGPLCDQAHCPWRELPVDDRERRNVDPGFEGALLGVEMRRSVVSEVHPDHNAVEPAELRHSVSDREV